MKGSLKFAEVRCSEGANLAVPVLYSERVPESSEPSQRGWEKKKTANLDAVRQGTG